MTTKTATGTFSISEVFSEGWAIFKSQWQQMYLAFFLIFLALTIPQMISQWFMQQNELALIGVVLSVGIIVWQNIINIAALRVITKIARGKKLEGFAEISTAAPLFWKYLWTTIRVGIIVFFGFLLFIIPGIIWAIKYSLAPWLVADRGLGAGEALRESARMTEGNKLKIFLFVLAAGLLNFLGALLFIVGLLITIPVTGLAQALIYDKLLQKSKN